MNVKEMAEALGLEQATPVQNAKVNGVYVCDLLSRVMGNCESGDVWITVQTHLNVLAVAELADASCMIIPEGISVDESIKEKAVEKEISLLLSDMTAYELCWKIHDLLA